MAAHITRPPSHHRFPPTDKYFVRLSGADLPTCLAIACEFDLLRLPVEALRALTRVSKCTLRPIRSLIHERLSFDAVHWREYVAVPFHWLPVTRLHNVSDSLIFLAQPMHTVTRIKYSDTYNAQVRHLPHTVRSIKFGKKFDKPVDHLPPELLELTLGQEFNQAVNSLPHGLRKLRVAGSGRFDQCLDRLPSSLRSLTLSSFFNHPLDNLPSGLRSLRLYSLCFQQSLEHLPEGLRKLHLVLHCDYSLPVRSLPIKLLKLLFWCDRFDGPIALPPGLSMLILVSCSFRQALVLPPTIETIKFHVESLSNPVDETFFPPSVKCVSALIDIHDNDPTLCKQISGKVQWSAIESGITATLLG